MTAVHAMDVGDVIIAFSIPCGIVAGVCLGFAFWAWEHARRRRRNDRPVSLPEPVGARSRRSREP